MDRLTARLESGAYSSGAGQDELLSALGKYEDLVEGIAAELELVQLNLQELKGAGRGRSATYTMLMGSKYMLEEMQKRVDEPAAETAGRLENLRRLLSDGGGDGIRDAEE